MQPALFEKKKTADTTSAVVVKVVFLFFTSTARLWLLEICDGMYLFLVVCCTRMHAGA